MCKVCEAKDETISVLKEEIEWLRLHSGTPTRQAPSFDSAWNLPIIEGEPLHLSEEEEEKYEMAQDGRLPPEYAQEFLASIGAMNTDVTVE